MHRFIEHIVTSDEDGLAVESILRGKLCMSSGLSRRLKKAENSVLLNGKPCYSNNRVSIGDIVCVDILACEDTLTQIEPKSGHLEIVYEDEDIVIINKEAGLLVHSAPGKRDDLSVANLYSGHAGANMPFHALNRLDKSTSGLMVIAKSGYIHERLISSLHTSDFLRTYLAVCVGMVPYEGKIDEPIKRCDDSVIKRKISSDGARALTYFKTLDRNREFSLVMLTPITGRTHQLRLHMSHIGFPLAGDFLYGTQCDKIARAALHSAHLEFTHPMTKKRICLDVPMPSDMAKLMK